MIRRKASEGSWEEGRAATTNLKSGKSFLVSTFLSEPTRRVRQEEHPKTKSNGRDDLDPKGKSPLSVVLEKRGKEVSSNFARRPTLLPIGELFNPARDSPSRIDNHIRSN